MAREEYTQDQIRAGDGLLTSGDWTLIYRRFDGTYFTAGRHDKIVGATLVGGGKRQTDGRPLVKWCE